MDHSAEKTNKQTKKPTRIKIKLKVFLENIGYLGRHEKDMRREKVISVTETAGIVLKILERENLFLCWSGPG